MSAVARADAYLAVPPYANWLGGLRWSSRGDALEYAHGGTLALVEEIDLLLEGVFNRPPTPPFAYVLQLLHVMKRGSDDRLSPELARLRRAYEQMLRVPSLIRNSGLLIGELCRELPGASLHVAWTDVRLALCRLTLFGMRQTALQPEALPFSPEEFERRIAERLCRFDDQALTQWLRHGEGPTAKPERLIEVLESLPVRVGKLLADALKRPRLVGAALLAPAIEAALALPPRRRSPDALPQGGYADVTTRGDAAHLLPWQFGLDSDDFIRRFAERELLYFKREEPHAPRLPQRCIILDQGVRTWGGVRLALTAATLSLLRKDPKRCGAARLFATSQPDPIDPTNMTVEALGELLEASDLSAQPGDCLTQALLDFNDDATPRDLILLTHPRNLRERAVLGAIKLIRPEDRLFALAVDAHGKAELTSWSERGPTAVRTFRIDVAAAEAAKPEGEPKPPVAVTLAVNWTGDIEPIGFPFRPGIVSEPAILGFDDSGEWLVTASRDGTLHGVARGGSTEVLPRPFADGTVLKHIDAILPVADGVVVCGRMLLVPPRPPEDPSATVIIRKPVSREDTRTELLVAVHYQRVARNVRIHVMGPPAISTQWNSYPDLHCITVATGNIGESSPPLALDLETYGRYPESTQEPSMALRSRATKAWARAKGGPASPQSLPVHMTLPPRPGPKGPNLLIEKNYVHVRDADSPWIAFEPKRDGLPLLHGATVDQAVLAGEVLAVSINRPGRRELAFFLWPDGNGMGSVERHFRGVFQLSHDGRLVAWRRGPPAVVVAETSSLASIVTSAPHARLHNRVGIRLEAQPFRLILYAGAFEHTFFLHEGWLMYAMTRNRPEPPRATIRVKYEPPTDYDPSRFPPHESAEAGPWRAALDRLGQVLLFTREGALVASFLIRRDRAAAWIPEGVFWGDAALIGGPPTPDAAIKIGRALLTTRE